MKNIIGIDPGQKGGICVMNAKGDVVDLVDVSKYTWVDVADFLRFFKEDSICYLEQVHSMPKQGVSSTFAFGKNYGLIMGILLGLGIGVVDVKPQEWMKTVGVGTRNKCASKTEWKNRLKGQAQKLYPQLGKQINNNTSDAILIARYGYLREK